MRASTRLFYLYAREDQVLCQALQKHLASLAHEDILVDWQEHKALAGSIVADAIDAALAQGTMVIALLSADFDSSSICQETLKKVLRYRTERNLLVVPILVRPVNWQHGPLGGLQILPQDGVPVTLWANQDAAWLDVARSLRRLLQTADPGSTLVSRSGTSFFPALQRARRLSALSAALAVALQAIPLGLGGAWWLGGHPKALAIAPLLAVCQALLLAWSHRFRFSARYCRHILHEQNHFETRGLGLLGTFALKLDKVFVELRVAPALIPDRPNLDLIANRELSGTFPIWHFLRHLLNDADHAALAVIGPPGCGKTTLTRHVALKLAARHLHSFGVRTKVPVLLFLRDYASRITADPQLKLGQLVDSLWESERLAHLGAPTGWFTAQIEAGRCILLLDGLDEVGDRQKRQLVSQWVDSQILAYPRCLIILTARPQGYRDAPLDRAHVLEVQPFKTAQVRRFIHNWYLANELSLSREHPAMAMKRATKRATDLLERLRRLPALDALTRNPLLLTMIALVHRFRGALPGSRTELYAEMCEALLGRWRESRGIQERFKAEQKRTALVAIARYLMERRCRDMELEIVLDLIGPLVRDAEVGTTTAQQLLLEIQYESGLFLEREPGRFGFVHLTFQEYLTAASWRAGQPRLLPWDALIADAWWHETLRQYAAQGDGTALLQACLAADHTQALVLASECIDEAKALDPTVREMAEARLVSGLNSENRDHWRVAVDLLLQRRLRSLLRMGDDREIDPRYVTCAEYQLFLEKGGDYCQPEHWRGNWYLNAAEGKNPVRGVRPADAERFCTWLGEHASDGANYRLPTTEEASEYPATNSPLLAAWCYSRDGHVLVGLTPEEQVSLREQVLRLGRQVPLRSLELLRHADYAAVARIPFSLPVDGKLKAHAWECLRYFSMRRDPVEPIAETPGMASYCVDRINEALDQMETASKEISQQLSAVLMGSAVTMMKSLHNRLRSEATNPNRVTLLGAAATLKERVVSPLEKTREQAERFTHAITSPLSDKLVQSIDDAIGFGRDLLDDLQSFSTRDHNDMENEVHALTQRTLGRACELDSACGHAASHATQIAAGLELTELRRTVSQREWAAARTRVQRLRSLCIASVAQLCIVLEELIVCAAATSRVQQRQALRRYVVHLLEYQLNAKTRPCGRLGALNHVANLVQHVRRRLALSPSDPSNLASVLYWHHQVTLAREDGRLPAWEGLRIVRTKDK